MSTATSTNPFAWCAEYSVGNSEIDAQHQKLLSITRDLHQAMTEGRGQPALGPILMELVRYTEDHFSFEEELLAASRYPALSSHQQSHRKLVQELRDLRLKSLDCKLTATLETMASLRCWLVEHIKGKDQAYARTLILHSRATEKLIKH